MTRPIVRCAMFSSLLLCIGLSSWQSATAKPRLHAVTPYVWRQGEQLEVLFQGEQLATVHQLLDYQQGITVHEWSVEEPKFARATISVADDCDLGIHALRLLTAFGITDLRLVYISQFVRVQEKEPNNRPKQAQEVPRNCSIVGRRDGNHDDWFSIDVKQGEQVSLELMGVRLGRALFDAKLLVVAPNGDHVAESDDTLLYKQDPFVSFIAGSEGTYRVQVASSSGEGNTNYFYALQVGSFPRPLRVSPNGAQPGETVEVTWIHPDGSTSTQPIQLPSRDDVSDQRSHVAHVYPEIAGKRAPSPLPMLLTTVAPTHESEPNNTYPQATRIELPGSVHAAMDKENDRDCFVFAAKKGEKLTARIHARRDLRSKLDCDLSLRHGDGKFITSNDDQPEGPDSFLQFDIPADGDYLLVTRDHQNRGGDEFGYWLEVGPAKPSVVINLPERNRNESMTLEVPRGARMALRVTATKKFVDGPLDLRIDDLPDGMTAKPARLVSGRPATALLVSAEVDATLQGSLVRLTGSIKAGDETHTAHLFQKQLLISGRNNVYVHGYEDSRLAVAIVDAAPFDIVLVQPNVPIVRSGSMELKLVATRQEGFVAPINVRLLDNPPGITTRSVVTISQGENEITLPTTANANAALGKSSIVAIASTTVNGTTHRLASKMVNLEVREPMLAVTFPKSNVARGQSIELVVGCECKHKFAGTAMAELLGLPAGVSCQPIEFTHGESQLKFTIATNETARLGRAGGLICRVTITENDEPIVHMLGTGQLRVDPAPAPAPTNTTLNENAG